MAKFSAWERKEVELSFTFDAKTRDKDALKAIALETLSNKSDWGDSELHITLHEIMAEKEAACSVGPSIYQTTIRENNDG